MNLRDLFDLSLVNRAIRSRSNGRGAEYTFGDMDVRISNRMAHVLIARGLAQGDRLCVYLANRIEMIDLYLACVKLGVMPIRSIFFTASRITHILGDAQPKLYVTETEISELSAEIAIGSGDRDVFARVRSTGDTPAALILLPAPPALQRRRDPDA